MTLTILRARLFFARVRASIGITYSMAIVLRIGAVTTWELFKVSMRGVWGIK